MASIITATVASGLTQQADNSGVLQLASGTGNLVTIPSVTGTAMVSGNMPAFSAYQSSGQTLSSATATKLNFQTEEFDTNNNFDSTTNMRFTPTVAGYYQVNGGLSNNTGTQTVLYIYKNGGVVKTGTNGSMFLGIVSAIIYLNGSSDYIELYGYFATGTTANTGVQNTYFQACMVRGA